MDFGVHPLSVECKLTKGRLAVSDEFDLEDILSQYTGNVKYYSEVDTEKIIKDYQTRQKFLRPRYPKYKTTLSLLDKAKDRLTKRIKKEGKLTESYLARVLRCLPDEYHRNYIKQFLITNYLHLDSVALLVNTWKDVQSITDQVSPQSRRIWDILEVSVPIVLATETWFVRTLYHRIEKQNYIDVRQWKNNPITNRLEPTRNGICIPISHQLKLLDVMWKLINKQRG